MLDKWQKITDILLKGLATLVLGIGSYWLAQQKFDLDRGQTCANFVQQSFDIVQKQTFTDARKSMLDFRIEQHSGICGPLDERYIQALNNAWLPPETTAEAEGGAPPAPPIGLPKAGDPPASSPPRGTAQPLEVQRNLDQAQWVAVSRKSDEAYSALNFDVVEGSQPPHRPGNIVRARWFVNIRARNTPIVRGDNPVIGQLLGGQCARILEHVSGTLNEWARVTRTTCPS